MDSYRPINRSPFRSFSYFPPVIKFLLLSNVGIFAFEYIAGNFTFSGIPLSDYFAYLYLWPIKSGFFYPWQVVTYMFLHGGIGHIFMNMLALWMFGMEIENAWGSKKFAIFYATCGIGSAVAHLILSPFLDQAGPLIGASGAIFGVLVAFGFMFPNRLIYFYFFIPVKAKYFIMGYLALEMYSLFAANDNIGHLAHLGGAIVGIIYMMAQNGGPELLSRLRSRADDDSMYASDDQDDYDTPESGKGFSQNRTQATPHRYRGPGQPVDAEYQDLSKPDPSASRVISQEEIDRILDKIAESGYQNLTPEEQNILLEASRKMDEQRH